MRMKHGLHLIILLGLWASSVDALTLPEAVQAGLGNSHYLKEVALGTDVERFKKESAESPFMPKVTTTYGYAETNRGGDAGRESSTAGVGVTLNLFNGFSDLNAFRSAETGYRAKRFEEQGFIEDFKLTIIKAYLEVLRAEKALGVAKGSVALLEAQLKTTRLSFEVGLFPKNEVLKVEARTVAARRKNLAARSRVRVAVFNLEKATGLSLPKGEPYHDFPEASFKPLDAGELESMMGANRSELKYLTTLLQAKGYDVEAVKGSWLPSVNLSAGWTGYGDSTLPDGRDHGYDDDTSVRANLRWELFDGKVRRSRLNIAETEGAKLRERKRETELTLQNALKVSLENYRLARESFEAAYSEVASARENYRVTDSMVKANSATPTDLLDANMILTRAENSQNEARYAMYKAMAEMERAVETPVFFDQGKGFFLHD